MSALSTTDIDSILSALALSAPLTDQINRSVVLANLLPKVRKGDPVKESAKFTGRTAAGGISQTAAAPTASAHVKIPFSLAMGEYSDTAAVTGRASAAAGAVANPDPLGGADLLEQEVRDANDNIALSLGQDLYSGDGSTANPIFGLATAVDSTGVYGGLDPDDYPEWVSTERTVAAASLNFEAIRGWMTGIENACGERPDMIIARPTVVDSLVSLYGSTAAPFVSEVVTAGGVRKLSAGTRAIQVEGVPVIGDRFCTNNTLYGLNSKYVYIANMWPYSSKFSIDQLVDRFMEKTLQVTGKTMLAEDAAAYINQAIESGFLAKLIYLAKTGNQDSVQIVVYAQLMVKRRNSCGKLIIT